MEGDITWGSLPEPSIFVQEQISLENGISTSLFPFFGSTSIQLPVGSYTARGTIEVCCSGAPIDVGEEVIIVSETPLSG